MNVRSIITSGLLAGAVACGGAQQTPAGNKVKVAVSTAVETDGQRLNMSTCGAVDITVGELTQTINTCSANKADFAAVFPCVAGESLIGTGLVYDVQPPAGYIIPEGYFNANHQHMITFRYSCDPRADLATKVTIDIPMYQLSDIGGADFTVAFASTNRLREPVKTSCEKGIGYVNFLGATKDFVGFHSLGLSSLDKATLNPTLLSREARLKSLSSRPVITTIDGLTVQVNREWLSSDADGLYSARSEFFAMAPEYGKSVIAELNLKGVANTTLIKRETAAGLDSVDPMNCTSPSAVRFTYANARLIKNADAVTYPAFKYIAVTLGLSAENKVEARAFGLRGDLKNDSITDADFIDGNLGDAVTAGYNCTNVVLNAATAVEALPLERSQAKESMLVERVVLAQDGSYAKEHSIVTVYFSEMAVEGRNVWTIQQKLNAELASQCFSATP